MESPFQKLRSILSAEHADGAAEVQIGDPRFDDWEVVREFGELETARAFRQHLDGGGIEAAITADWPLDRFGRGDIMLQVPPGSWSEAEELLSGLE